MDSSGQSHVSVIEEEILAGNGGSNVVYKSRLCQEGRQQLMGFESPVLLGQVIADFATVELGVDHELSNGGSEKREEAGLMGSGKMSNFELGFSRLYSDGSGEVKETSCEDGRGSLGENGEVGLVSKMLVASLTKCAQQKEQAVFARHGQENTVSPFVEQIPELEFTGIVLNESDIIDQLCSVGETGQPYSAIDNTSDLVQNGETFLSLLGCTQQHEQNVIVRDGTVLEQMLNYELGFPGRSSNQTDNSNQLDCLGRTEEQYMEIERSRCADDSWSVTENGETTSALHLLNISSTKSTQQQQKMAVSRDISVGSSELDQMLKCDYGYGGICSNLSEKINHGEISSKGEQNVENPLVLLHDFPSKYTQRNKDADMEIVIDSSEKIVCSIVRVEEEKRDGLDGEVTGSMSQKLNTEETYLNVSGEVSTLAYDRAIEKSTSLQLSHLDVFNLRANGHMNSDITSSSRRRSSRRSKPIPMNETRKIAREHRKSVKNKRVSSGPFEISLRTAKRKRSCLCKPPRSSIWGDLGSIVRGFTDDNAVLKHDSQIGPVENSRKHKFRGSQGSKRGEKARAGKISKRQSRTSSGQFSSRVKMEGLEGKNNKFFFTEGIESPASASTTVSEHEFVPEHPLEVGVSNGLEHKLREDVHVPFLNRNLAKHATSLFTSTLDFGGDYKGFENTVAQHVKVENTLGNNPGASVILKSKVLEEDTINNQYSDQGASPDSEVINIVQDITIGAIVKEELHDAVPTSSSKVVGVLDFINPTVTTSTVELTSSKKGNKHGKVNQAKPRRGHRTGFGCNSSESCSLTTKENYLSSSAIVVGLPYISLPDSGILNIGEHMKFETDEESYEFSGTDIGMNKLELGSAESFSIACKTMDLKLSKSSKSRAELSKQRSHTFDISTYTGGNSCDRKKEDNKQSVYRRKVKEKDNMLQVATLDNHLQTNRDVHFSSRTGNHSESRAPAELIKVNFAGVDTFDLNKSSTSNKLLSEEISSMTLTVSDNQHLPPRKAWVLCDDCSKWRCISATLADSIEETNCRWTCKENLDKAFADCSIPQEKTNAEINAELEISDGSCEEDASAMHRPSKSFEHKQLTVFEQASWKLIKSNLFLHRSRKSTPIDEVLDMYAYEARQREYAFRGQKHFYFMTLTASEVIDACAKGNLGRFINHSCNPNCRTEKGEELTFDYNYQRVFGAAAKKCICGSSECRGYLGGDPLNTEIVVQDDSDDEYPEPLMVLEAGDHEHQETLILTTEITPLRVEQAEISSDITLRTEDTTRKSIYTVELPETFLPTDVIISNSLHAVQPLEISPLNDENVNNFPPFIQYSSTSSESTNTMTKSLSPPVAVKSESLSNTADNESIISKSRPLKKSSRSSHSVKKSKSSISPGKAIKPQIHASKPKKIVEGVAGRHFEGVEEKLSELLDTDGGINRRKGQDATKGYLKLLFVTAASGDNINGEGVQRTRDLSIILDALLKTKSRTVLVDVINKNGLQMLHNIIKQNRKNFNKTPIIRKLLKVLEFLAQEEILTSEHINCPPRAGVESFAESIVELAWHADTQVHQIARNFRDRWIPRTVRRRINYSGRDDNVMAEQPQSCPNSNQFSLSYRSWDDQDVRPTEAHLDANGTEARDFDANERKTRKRKSRWDQPTDISINLHSLKIIECQKMQVASVEALPCTHEDAPPGFSSLQKTLPVSVPSSSCASELITGCLQESYLSHLPMSYGIPLSLVDQLGCEAENSKSWLVAPAIPFHPFPPLPSVPRHSSRAKEVHQDAHQMDTSVPSTSGLTQTPHVAAANSAVRNQWATEGSLGRRYFRQQKWNNNNNRNNVAPWVRSRYWEGSKGHSNSRNSSIGNMKNDIGGSFSRSRGENVNSTFYHQPRHHR
ncbi:hypothetical protein GIB67_001523 [Kingdonia uniflora]|uniref:Histone-lysine N-methyltransferase ASHH2 n=1 Tax=Kingdonia uniflora TaxID=39325 RepID=A0A7J7LZJ2_9MAGN|nr:hypothetical protein GIB67_001523 [Kingdonia uniflora]